MKKIYRITKNQLDEITKAATSSATRGGREICGLLMDNGYFIELIRAKNMIRKGGGFQFNSTEIRTIQTAAKQLNHKIIGTFHSHPAYLAVPSDSDIRCTLDDSLMLIIDVLGKKAALWHIKDKKKRKVRFGLKN